MVERVAGARAQAIAEFAASLRELRASAGTPSFREMSGRSKAISHTTLHEAAQGNRLPSWSTTVEFVKACDADPADFEQAWQRADETVRAGGDSPSAPEPGPAATPPAPVPVTPVTPPPDLDVAEPASGQAPARTRRRRTVALATIGAVAVAAAAVVGVLVATSGGDDPNPAPTSAGGFTAADCPVKPANPPPAEPANPGDHAAFITDVSLPDCSHVGRGQSVVKTWRLKNVGTVPWIGYTLHRIDLPQSSDQCQTITDVAVPDTQPGDTVDISTAVTTPRQAAFCFVRFKVQDAQGRVAFPGGRPLNFQVVVD